MGAKQLAALGGSLIGILAIPFMRVELESSMAAHMYLQLPLLVLGGVLVGRSFPRSWIETLMPWNRFGVPGVLLALLTSLIWMLPRHLDAALEQPLVEATKFVTLALFVGVPLSLSWPLLPSVGRGVVWSNLIAMLVVLGWLYQVAPSRVCNNYLLDQQLLAGRLSLLLAMGIALYLVISLFVGRGAVDGIRETTVVRE